MVKHLSATQISMFLRCPRQWCFRYIEQIKSPPSGAMKQSGVFHRAAEHNYKQKVDTGVDLPVDEMTDFYAETFEKEFQREEVVLDPGDTIPALKDQGVGIVKEHRKSIAPLVNPVEVERKIELTLKDETLNGEQVEFGLIAVVDVVDDQNRIRDNKALARTPSQEDVDKDLQLSTYSLARRLQTKSVEPELTLDIITKTKTPTAKVLKTTRSREALRLHLNRIGMIARAIEAEAFPTNPTGWWCSKKFCGYWDICMGGTMPVHTDLGENLEQQLKESLK